ncbi:MAG TPA: hypothetical protein EYQ25_04975 [Planctomycetes bacterium]|nr:hypothetical protein [Planctomycetota bacterium]HIL36091.1 hypothetical protein [Planctomycetota bacterium]
MQLTQPFRRHSSLLSPVLGLTVLMSSWMLSSCAAPLAFVGVAGAAGIYATQEYRTNSTAMWIDHPAQDVYNEALLLLEDMAPLPVNHDPQARTAEASFSKEEYTFRVESRGSNRCRISVGVQRFGLWNRGLADAFLARLIERMQKSRS